MENLERIISQHPFFTDLERTHLSEVVGCARNVRFKAGERIFQSGEPADTFYLIREGLVTLQIPIPGHDAKTIQTVNEGNVLGWSWIFPPHRTYFDASAVEETRAIGFDGVCLRGKCEEDKALGYELMTRFAKVLRERLRATHLQLLDFYKVEAPG